MEKSITKTTLVLALRGSWSLSRHQVFWLGKGVTIFHPWCPNPKTSPRKVPNNNDFYTRWRKLKIFVYIFIRFELLCNISNKDISCRKSYKVWEEALRLLKKMFWLILKTSRYEKDCLLLKSDNIFLEIVLKSACLLNL